MYVGFVLVLWPYVESSGPLYLSDEPQFFGFEDDLNSVSSVQGNPMVVTSPSASESKAIGCQNQDYVRWNLGTPSRTLDFGFKIFWTKLPKEAKESLIVGEIWGEDYSGSWQDIFSTNLFCDRSGYRLWCLWTGVPTGHDRCISSDIVSGLETNRWYSIRMTADLKKGTYRVYMDGVLLASLTDIVVPDDVYIDFIRLGGGVRGEADFITYFDDVFISFLGPMPPDQQWSVQITSSIKESTNPYGVVNVDSNDNLTVNALQISGYVFNVWIFDGIDYSSNSTITIPAQSKGTQHALYAVFTNTNPKLISTYNWFPFQLIGLIIIGIGGYLLWVHKKQES